MTTARPEPPPSQENPGFGRARAKLAALVTVSASLVLVAWLSAYGGPHDAPTGLAACLVTFARAGLGPALYLLAAAGYGRAFSRLLAPARSRATLQLASGLALLLLFTHVLGVLGILAGRIANVPVALIVNLVGIGLLFAQLQTHARRGALTFPAFRLRWLAPIPAAILLLVASLQPPGWLWGSEFGGFDALSYHLQLVNEWFAAGRVQPFTHNVYSFLPSLVEAAFLHVHASVPDASSVSLAREGLLTHQAAGAIAAQLFHASLALISAWIVARVCTTLAQLASAPRAEIIGVLAGTIFLATPWTVVVGSLAYNEMGLTLGLAAAMLACIDPGLTPRSRAILAGLFTGIACGSKATAIFFAGLPVLILLLHSLLAARLQPSAVVKAILAGCIAGLASLAPWLARNWLACSNPVFPFAHDLFGPSHWTPEQFARFAAGHTFSGSLSDRLSLLILPDHSVPAGARHRGLMHAQYAWLFPITLLAALPALISARTRRLTLLILTGLALQVISWMWLTHLQSRFLIPAIVPACCTIALGAAALSRADRRSPAARLPIALTALAMLEITATSYFLYTRERLGHPNEALIFGPHEFTGQNLGRQLAALPERERQRLIDNATPEMFVNLNADALFPRDPSGLRSGRLYLLGDSTPFYLQVPVLYHTTWDASPIGDAMRQHPADPAAWTRSLRADGVTHVLINFSELARLGRSGPAGSTWYDPTVTPDAVASWARTLGKPLAQWPESQRYLFALPGDSNP